jgi:hypothetical protein
MIFFMKRSWACRAEGEGRRDFRRAWFKFD